MPVVRGYTRMSKRRKPHLVAAHHRGSGAVLIGRESPIGLMLHPQPREDIVMQVREKLPDDILVSRWRGEPDPKMIARALSHETLHHAIGWTDADEATYLLDRRYRAKVPKGRPEYWTRTPTNKIIRELISREGL